MAITRKLPRIAYRRGRDTAWQVWWPILVTVLAYVMGGVGLYVGMANKLAVQTEQISSLQRSSDGMKSDLRERIGSLEANVRGLEAYIIQLHQQERRER